MATTPTTAKAAAPPSSSKTGKAGKNEKPAPTSFMSLILDEARDKDEYGEYISFDMQSDIDDSYLKPKFYFRSGITIVDELLGFEEKLGLGSGRMTELYGENRTGKSALAVAFLNQALIDHPNVHGLYVDMERALTEDRLRPYPVLRSSRCSIIVPSTLDKAFAIMLKALKAAHAAGKTLFVVFDSVAAMKTDTEMNVEEGKIVMMAQAQMFSKELPRVRGLLSKTHSHLLMLNQMRDKNQAGGKPGMPAPDHTPGGKAIGFYADYRIRTRSVGKFSFANGTTPKAGARPSGFVSMITTIKNKVGVPDRSVRVPLTFFPSQGRPSGLSELWSIFHSLREAKPQILLGQSGKYWIKGHKDESFSRMEWSAFLSRYTDLSTGYPVYSGPVAEALGLWRTEVLSDTYGQGEDTGEADEPEGIFDRLGSVSEE